MTKTSILERLKLHPRVEFVDDERGSGNGIIVTLRQGYSFDALTDNRVQGADTASQALAMVRSASKPFGGPYQ